MKVYVVMGNDYPDNVFANEAAAEKYVAEKRAGDKAMWNWENPHRPSSSYCPRIYWRVYDFELQEK